MNQSSISAAYREGGNTSGGERGGGALQRNAGAIGNNN